MGRPLRMGVVYISGKGQGLLDFLILFIPSVMGDISFKQREDILSFREW